MLNHPHPPIFALQSWTVKRRTRGWYVRRTDHDEKWRGPYRSEISASLVIARQLAREIRKRAGTSP